MPRDYTYDPPAGEAGNALAPIKGEVVQMPQRNTELEPVVLRDTTFTKIATKPVSVKAAKILMAPVDEENEIDILPTGEVYMSHVFVRRRLNKAFGPMGWALRPLTIEKPDEEIHQMYQRYALVASGRVVATAVGSAKYFPKTREGYANPRTDYADTAEAAKSNALTRCSKDLGIGSECWDRRWILRWRNKYAVHVWVVEKKRGRGAQAGETDTVDYWRRIDAEPFKNELRPVEDSPNQDAWRKQAEAWIAMLKQEKERTEETAKKLRAARIELIQARKDLNAAKKEQGQKPQEPNQPEPPQEPQAAAPAAPQEPQPQTQQRGEREPTPHAPTAVNAKDRPWLIRTIEKPKTNKSPYKVVMMDGSEWFTFSSRVAGELQQFWAGRKKLTITKHEVHEIGGRKYRHILEYAEMQ